MKIRGPRRPGPRRRKARAFQRERTLYGPLPGHARPHKLWSTCHGTVWHIKRDRNWSGPSAST